MPRQHRSTTLVARPGCARGIVTAILVLSLGMPANAVDSTSAAGASPDRGGGMGRGTGGGNGKGGGRGTGGGSGQGGGGALDRTANDTPLKLETIKGEIISVDDGSAPGGPGSAGANPNGRGATRPGPMISVRTETGTLSVHAGAPHYRHEHRLDLKVGDRVEITGVRSMRVPDMFIAHSITRGSQVVQLRDARGDKLWKPRQRGAELALASIKARVVALDAAAAHNPASGAGRSSQFIVVRAGTEELAIEVGPAEYRQKQGLTLAVDDDLTIAGWRLPSAQTAGKPIVLAASLTKGKTVVKLRDDHRRPLWGRKK